MNERPKKPIKACDCCLMPDTAGIRVSRYGIYSDTGVDGASYCDLCARHIKWLGIKLGAAP